jgi:hypothetical protein
MGQKEKEKKKWMNKFFIQRNELAQSSSCSATLQQTEPNRQIQPSKATQQTHPSTL